jgi:O-succinylbenzoic acid--CoA ligase
MSLQRFAGGGLINSLCLLPLYHISGFQQLVRALATGGRLMIDEWASVAAGRLPSLPECNDGWTVSLVPTQLHRLIASPAAVEWLRGFRLILLGGAPAGAELLATARRAGLALAQSYGSSETAAAVAAVTPTCFLAGNNGYEALGHASIRIVDTESGMESPPGHIGQVIVESSSLFLGYWPEPRPPGPWAAGDLGLIDAYGRLQLVGRCDAAINTGGEKVHPAEVEAALLSTGAFSEVFVSGAPDPRWGECVVACFPAADQPSLDKVELQLRTQLSPHKLPRRWLPVQDWPLTSQGKTDRNRLRSLVSSAKNST